VNSATSKPLLSWLILLKLLFCTICKYFHCELIILRMKYVRRYFFWPNLCKYVRESN
jgi:hypothetical protein